MPHYLTNRGVLRLLQNKWNDTAGTVLKAGIIVGSSVPSGLTEVNIRDVNFISDLLALTDVDEATDPSYVRQTITRTAAVEDDSNNRINMDASDIDWDTITNTTACAMFWFDDAGGSDSAREVYGVDIFSTSVVTNGAGWIYGISDFIRAA
jgi:hypothetical protein